MRIIRFLLKIAVFPNMLIVTVIQWFGAFIIGFSSAVFNVLVGLFLLVAVLSYMMGLSAGAEAVDDRCRIHCIHDSGRRRMDRNRHHCAEHGDA